MTKLELVSSAKCFEGHQNVYQHKSDELKCDMKFSVYLPPQASTRKCPVIYWLSGLTCSERNFIDKSGFQRHAAKHGIIVVGPDTSPRGCNVEGEEDRWDFGTGAGFYVDATTEKFKENYRMYSYVTKELPPIIEAEFPTNGKVSIMGHSMGGHGAITIGLKNPTMYSSVSAFSPICNPSEGPWGQLAFKGYLGEDCSSWKNYDSCILARVYKGPPIEIFIDQGLDDPFLEKELLVERFPEACKGTNITPILRMQEGYEHSYLFVTTFIGDHFDYHAKFLQ